jgi:flagellar protein FliJ
MKRYEFRAEKVLRVRRLQEDLARAGVAAARHAEQTADATLAASQQRYAQLSVPSAPLTPAGFLAAREQAGYRATAVTNAEHQRRAAAAATADALTGWHEAHRKVDGLERLDARRRDEYAIEAGRAQDAVVDELVVSRARRSA